MSCSTFNQISVRGDTDKRKIHTEFSENLRESSSSAMRLEEERCCCSGLFCKERPGYDLRRKQMMQYDMSGEGVLSF